VREIVLDTETTGLSPETGDRIVEIGCVELIDRLPTGNVFHRYIDPQKLMPAEATQITGITDDMLKGMPLFGDICDEFMEFIRDSPLVIHNAAFDIKFLNAELSRLHRPLLHIERAIDTLEIARKRFPGAQLNLDALSRRLSVDLSSRTKHGALIDAEILSRVYLELIGGRQRGLELEIAMSAPQKVDIQRALRPVRSLGTPSSDELFSHAKFVEQLGSKALWLKFLEGHQ